MIECGRYSGRVPRGYDENLRFRKKILNLADERTSYREALLHACRVDPLFFIDCFGWQVNPAKFGREVGPFILYPFQSAAIARIVRNIINHRSTAVEKSRYQGGTWMNLFLDDWFALFHENKNYILISHKKEAVDNGSDPNSLFWKLDFIHRHLPDWMLRGARHVSEGNMIYPGTSSYGQGYATTKTAGLGGRATVVTSDEHGEQRDGKKLRARTANIGPRVFVSAHYSNASDFLDICQNPDYDKVQLHWTENPQCNRGLYHFDHATNGIVRHDAYAFPADYEFVRDGTPTGGPRPGWRSPWYDLKAKEIGDPRDVACQLDMDPTGASNLVFDQKVVAAAKARIEADGIEPTFVGDLLYDSLARPLGLQSNAKGSLRLWLNLKDDRPPLHKYFLGADVARGNAGPMSTPSCIGVFNEFGEQVGEYASPRIEPTPFADYYVALARWFWDGYMIWEANGPGGLVSKRVIEHGYWNFYWKKAKEGQVFGERDSDTPGWYNTGGGEAKTRLFKDHAADLREGKVTINSLVALEEYTQVVWVGPGRAEHNGERNKDDPSEAGMNHADRVIANALGGAAVAAYRKESQPKPPKDAVPGNFYSTAAGLEVLFERQQRQKKDGTRSRWVRIP